MDEAFRKHAEAELKAIRAAGLHKAEQVLFGPQDGKVLLADGREVVNLCANNYLGLSDHPAVIEAARSSFVRWGYGLASVRFICGTQEIHLDLEAALSKFLGTEATLLYSSCFDANAGLFETLLGPEDAVVSDALNHASIIDGIRLCKARRYRYANADLGDLEKQLAAARKDGARFTLVATDGVFSMDGIVAPLAGICDLAEKFGALVMVDDSHATGVVGRRGRGTPELPGCKNRVDIITGTLGKALGGATGGFTSGRRAVIELLRQRSRPYLFSNALAPSAVCASLAALEVLSGSGELRERLRENTRHFRRALRERGFAVEKEGHPIIPIHLGDAVLAQKMAAGLLKRCVLAVGFFYPVVPEGKVRIRTQVSAAHSTDDLDFAADGFAAVRDVLARGEGKS